MARFKLVKHRFSYHVIGMEGVKKPRGGKKSTYKEQLISSHFRGLGSEKALLKAQKAKASYETAKLSLSCIPETSRIHKVIKELHIGIIIAVVCGLLFEAGIKFLNH